MKRIGHALVALAMVLSSGCAAYKMNANAQYHESTDFSGLRDYSWVANQKDDGSADPRINFKFVEPRLRTAVEEELDSKGYAKASNNPDFMLSFYVSRQDRQRVNRDTETGDGPGAGLKYMDPALEGGWTYSGSETYVHEFSVGTLILDVMDTKSKQLVWRGTAQAQFNPEISFEQKEKKIDQVVQKLLAQFPPE